MHQYKLVNSFGCQPFTGNPVAVFLGCDDIDLGCMQQLAAELKLSETTFVCSPQRDGHANVRIFTPVNELGFAGHPLLGTALVLALERGQNELRIETLKGIFRFRVEPEPSHPLMAYVQMEQPTPLISACEYSQDLLEAIGITHSILPIDRYDVGPKHVFIGVENIAALSAICPDYKKLSQFSDMAALCFCPDGSGGWRLRMFSPAYGVTEDAATGSAAGPLAWHLYRYGRAELGEKIKITQGVEMGRPSQMNAVANIENDCIHLEAGGYAFQAATGQYFI